MLNKVMVIGNLGQDAEAKYTSTGTAVANMSVAVNEKWKDKDGSPQERTEWVRVVIWGRTAEAIGQYLTKGKQVFVEGRLQTRKWEDREGNTRYTTEVNASNVRLLGGGGRREAREETHDDHEPAAAGGGRQEAPDLTDDEIPF